MSKRKGRDEAQIVLVSDGTTIRGTIGASILRVLQEHGVPIDSSCGGNGTCGECRIRFLTSPPEPASADLVQFDRSEIARGWRLACAHTLVEDVWIEHAASTGELDRKADEDVPSAIGELKPSVHGRTIDWTAPSAEDARSLKTRLTESLGARRRVPCRVLRRMPEILRGDNGPITVIERADVVLDVLPESEPRICGLAIDVGTTTLAVHLFDLASGQPLGSAAARNPQRRYGADVISRIAHVRRSPNEGLAALHDAAVDGLNELVGRLTPAAGISSKSIYGAVAVGNPTMIHLLLSIDPRGIDLNPYAPVFTDRVGCYAEELGLAAHPRALVETLPAVSAYVGADIVSGILATGLDTRGGSTLYLDIGTNGEIVLAVNGRLFACSTAAGPAFEGASIVRGMAALDGAIESVSITDNEIACDVIGDGTARGICGTGLVSAIAELVRVGVIDPSGRLDESKSPFRDRFEGTGAQRRFRLTDGLESVYLHQGDVREFQLGKAAIRTGIEILLERVGVTAKDLDGVLIGGAFSARLSSRHLVTTGLLPDIDPGRIGLVGNAAGRGAIQVLLDDRLIEKADRLADNVEYVELSGASGFSDLFVRHIPFPSR